MTVNVYKVCVKNNVTIRMPEEVPPNISQVFKDLIPFTVSVVLLYGFELIVKGTLGVTVAESIGTLLAPLFSVQMVTLELHLSLVLMPSSGLLVSTVLQLSNRNRAITYANIDANLHLIQAGQHADKVITSGTQMFIVTMGGTGATLIVPFLFMWICKSERNRAIGRASVVPTFFGVNEPILFGAPIVLESDFLCTVHFRSDCQRLDL